MEGFSLVDDIIKKRGTEGKERIDKIVSALNSANNMLLDIVEDINSANEMSNVYYEDRYSEIDRISRCGGKFESFQYLGGEYYHEVDHPFFSSYEHAANAMSEIKNDEITVDNSLGITETTTEYYQDLNGSQSRQVTKVKDKLTMDDLLTYGDFDKIMKSQYDAIAENLKIEAAKTEDAEDDKTATSFTYDQYIQQLTTSGEFDFSYKWLENLSLGIDMIPVVGDLKGIIEAVTGKDCITGRDLGLLERGLCLLSIIPFVGDGAKIGGSLVKGALKQAGKDFAKEMITNMAFMAGSKVAEAAGVNPLFAMLLYQGGRIGYKNWDNIIKILDKTGVVDSMTMTKRSIKHTLENKWEAIGEITEKVEDVDGGIKITLKNKMDDIKEVIFRKEELTPFQLYVCRNGCFTGDTLVVTKDGTKRIDLIKEGEYVLARSDSSEKVEFKKVLHTMCKFAYDFIYITIDGEEIKSTLNHLFKSVDGWKSAEELEVGEGILDTNGEIKHIESIKLISHDKSEPIYNLEVEEYHTFFVGECGVLVHNQYKYPELNKIYKKFFDEYIKDESIKGNLKSLLDRMEVIGDEKLIRQFDKKIYDILNNKNIDISDVSKTKDIDKLINDFEVSCKNKDTLSNIYDKKYNPNKQYKEGNDVIYEGTYEGEKVRYVLPIDFDNIDDFKKAIAGGDINYLEYGCKNKYEFVALINNMNTFLGNLTEKGRKTSFRSQKNAGKVVTKNIGGFGNVSIKFDKLGFPIFEGEYLKKIVDIKMNDKVLEKGFSGIGTEGHKKEATKALLKEYENDANGIDINKYLKDKGFSDQAIDDIKRGREHIDGFIWHHNQVEGKMQLVVEEIHRNFRHTGGDALWGEKI